MAIPAGIKRCRAPLSNSRVSPELGEKVVTCSLTFDPALLAMTLTKAHQEEEGELSEEHLSAV